jgi:hypothetical protein
MNLEAIQRANNQMGGASSTDTLAGKLSDSEAVRALTKRTKKAGSAY